MMTEDDLKKIVGDVDDRGYLRSRESTSLEFKEAFGFQNLARYLKTIAAFANTRGGTILFGIADSPRRPVGIPRKKFDEIKVETISTYLSEYFSPEILWDLGIFRNSGKWFGYISIAESQDKPVICKKNSGKIVKDGAIYYRYRGQSRVIEFPELKQIHIAIREHERSLWMSHVERIAKIGPKNVAFVDLMDGIIDSINIPGQFLVDEALLEKLKTEVSFIEKGTFCEVNGKPTLRVVGDLKPAGRVIVPSLDPNKDYPYLCKHLAQELQIRPHDVQVLIWKNKLKHSKRYSIKIDTSDTSRVFKYSRFALKKLRDILDSSDDKQIFLKKIGKQYSRRNKG